MFIDIATLKPFERGPCTSYKRNGGTGEVHCEVVIIEYNFGNGDCFKFFRRFNFFCKCGYVDFGSKEEGFDCLVDHATFYERFVALNVYNYVRFGDKFSNNSDTIGASIYILWSDVNLCAKVFCDLCHLFVINGNDDILQEL